MLVSKRTYYLVLSLAFTIGLVSGYTITPLVW